MKNKLKLLLITLLISNLLIGQAFASIVNTNLSLSNDAEQSNDIEQSNDAEQSNDVDTLLVTPVDTDVTFWNTASGLAQSRFPFASKCLQHSAGPIRHIGTSYTPSTLTFSSTSSESKKIQSTNGWSSVVSQAKDYFNNKTGSLSKTFYASVESNDNEDVYLALHNFTVTASVTNKSLNGNYTINFDIYDWYDFDEPQGEYLNKTRILVGLAYSSQKLGTLKNYAIKINGIKVNATSSNSSSSGNSNGSYSRVLKVTSPLMYGADIKNVQSRLNSLGYNAGTADGYYGNNTKNAVISFQKANGLTADGEVGPATWNKLFG